MRLVGLGLLIGIDDIWIGLAFQALRLLNQAFMRTNKDPR